VLRRGECARKEVREAEGSLQGLPGEVGGTATWGELVALWRDRLGRLAAEVRAGRADVSPLEPDVCAHCELPSLCRVTEGEHGDSEEEEG
jgi:hypothetical protein